MKNQQFSSLGYDVNLSVPESVSEFDLNAKKEGAALTEAIANVVYRGALAEFRDEFTAKVEESTGHERKSKIVTYEVEENGVKVTKNRTRKNDAGEEEVVVAYTESEADYIKRVEALGASKADLQAIANAVASTIVFDASPTVRKAKVPSKPAAKFLDAAKKLLAGGKIEELNKRLHKAIGKQFTATGETTKDEVALAGLVREFTVWNEQQSIAKLTA